MAAATTSTSSRSIGRFIAGDPLRGLGAIAVVTYHTFQSQLRPPDYATPKVAYGDFVGQLVTNSASVIFLFFVGSGYLLGRPYVRAFVLGRPPPRLGNFARNRVARIVPPALVAITATLVIRGTGGSSTGEVLAVYGLVQNYVPSAFERFNVHIWSVDAEAAFYLVLPLASMALIWAVGRRGTRNQRLATILGLLTAITIASIALRARHPVDLPYLRRLPTVAWALALGMALGAVEIVAVDWAPRLKRPALIGGTLFALGWAVLLLVPGTRRAGDLERSLIALVGTGLIMGGPLLQQWAGAGALRILDNRVLQALGRWSYSIYLFHVIALYQFRSHVDAATPAREAATIVLPVLAASILLGALSFQFIEKTFMRFRGVTSQPGRRDHVPPNVADSPAPVGPQ